MRMQTGCLDSSDRRCMLADEYRRKGGDYNNTGMNEAK